MMLFVIGLFGVLFHQRHVLVRGRMKDDRRAEPIEHLAQPTPVANIGNDGGHLEVRIAFVQLDLRIEDAVLAVAEQDETRGTRTGDLPAQLESD